MKMRVRINTIWDHLYITAQLTVRSDANKKKLKGAVEDIKNDIGTYEMQIKTAKRVGDTARLQQVQKKLDKAKDSDLPAAEQKLSNYIAKVAADKKAATQKKSKPTEKSSKTHKTQSKNGPTQPQVHNPDVIITDYRGITRSATGYSFTAARLTRLGGK
jgi:hypothetical protein